MRTMDMHISITNLASFLSVALTIQHGNQRWYNTKKNIESGSIRQLAATTIHRAKTVKDIQPPRNRKC